MYIYNRKKWLQNGHSLASALTSSWILPFLLASSWDFTWLNPDKTDFFICRGGRFDLNSNVAATGTCCPSLANDAEINR